jgi:hypothetical protein
MADQAVESGFSALHQFARRRKQADQAGWEQCELCSEPIPPEHRHLLEIETRQVVCVCQACSILFDRSAAGMGKHRLIPDRRLNLVDFGMSDAQWESLRVPVGMVFFFYSTPAGRVLAYYPGPMGATESLLPLDTWGELVMANPALKGMVPDVEALLVNRARGANDHFLVPIDDCFRLIAVIRQNWRGFTGGQEVWEEIGRFFKRLSAQSRATRQGGDVAAGR